MSPDYIIVCLCVCVSLSRERERSRRNTSRKIVLEFILSVPPFILQTKNKEKLRLTSACLNVNILDKSLAMLQVKQLSFQFVLNHIDKCQLTTNALIENNSPNGITFQVL